MAWIIHLYKEEERKESIKDYLDEDFTYAIKLIIERLKEELNDA